MQKPIRSAPLIAGSFSEDAHPRDTDGKFSPTDDGSDGGAKKSAAPRKRTVNWTGKPVDIEYTGETVQKWGRTYHKVKVLTGYKKGKVIDFPQGPDEG